MKPDKLTITERQILANQFRILDHITEGGEDYRLQAEILERGFTGQYERVFSVHAEEIPKSVCDETRDILHMYRVISNAIAALTEEEREEMDLKKLRFEGFDGNHDDHYHYASFMIEEMGLWQELEDANLNSHSQGTLPKYRRMMEVYNERMGDGKYELNKEDLEAMIEQA